MAHRYGDPCRTCGKPAYDYNVDVCAECHRVEEHNGTSPIQQLLYPGMARVLAEIRELNS